jgi:hypothetical protein
MSIAQKNTIETPSLSEVMRKAIDSQLTELHVCMPARVKSYDATLQTANVQPTLKRVYTDGEKVSLPVINNVPVCHPRAGQAIVHLPLKADDIITLVFSSRSLDSWKLTTGTTEIDPEDPRKHALSDAYAIPGGYPSLNPAIVTEANDLQLKHTLAEINIKEDGNIVFKAGPLFTVNMTNSGKVSLTNAFGELIDLIIQALQDIQAGTCYTGIGQQPLVFIQLSSLLTLIQSFKE